MKELSQYYMPRYETTVTYPEVFWEYLFSRGIQGRIPKGHNRELWTTIFSYKHVWMACVGVISYRKCNYYALINCIRHCIRREIKIKFIKIFSFLLIWDKSLGSHTGWPVAKSLWISPWTIMNYAKKSSFLLSCTAFHWE